MKRKRPTPGVMNSTEADWYHELCNHGYGDGEFVEHAEFESVRLVLGHRCTYTPDFFVVMSDGSVEFHEVKGFWRDDARVKIKVAARKFFWAKFIAVQKRPKKEWNEYGLFKIEEIKP